MEKYPTQKIWHKPDQYWPTESNHSESELREIIAASGISARLWRLYAYFWLVCLAFPISSLIQTPPAGLHLFVALSGLITFITIYFWVMWPHPLTDLVRTRFRLWRSSTLLIALTGLVIFLGLSYGNAFLWLFIGVSAIAGITLPFRLAATAVFALTLLTLGTSIGFSERIASANWMLIIPLVLLVRGLGLDVIGFIRLSDALRELHAARKELARQVVIEERLRMARDLHDLLGHTLSLITLKSELAGRLLEKDPISATQEIREVEQVARQALREVREAVTGYRQQSLRGELDGARQILGAAGIACTIDDKVQMLPPDVEALLAWVMREGVTNVIRHSRARQCRIHIQHTGTMVCAEIINDGHQSEGNAASGLGSGLSGLTERVTRLGGSVMAGPLSPPNAPGFRLRVEIPMQNRAMKERE
ncbi:MAG: sensor histidine kinase [Anaerolineales bacterium]